MHVFCVSGESVLPANKKGLVTRECQRVITGFNFVYDVTRKLIRYDQCYFYVIYMLNKNSLAVKKCEANQKPQWL